MLKRFFFTTIFIFLIQSVFSVVDYEIKQTLPENDRFYNLEKDILSKGKIKIDFAKKLLLDLLTDKELSEEKSYIALRVAYQYLADTCYFDLRSTNDENVRSKIFADIEEFKSNIDKCIIVIKAKHRNCAQIVELLGDFAYFNTSIDDGKNIALILHYKAFCLGQTTESVKCKLALDLMNMNFANVKLIQNKPQDLRKSYLFSLKESEPTLIDAEGWRNLSNYFYNMCKNKDVIKNEAFFNYWLNENKNFKVNDDLTKKSLKILFEQLLVYDLELAKESESYLLGLEQIKKDKELADIGKNKMDEKMEASKLAILKLDEFKNLPNDISKIENCISNLTKFKKELIEYKELPNFKDIKALYPEKEEAEVLNGFYLYAFTKDYKNILKYIETLKSKTTDTRICFLKYLCLKKSDASKEEIASCVDLWLKIDPNNRQAKHIKLDLEIEKGDNK